MMIYFDLAWKIPLSFGALWAMTRVLGKKQISQLTLFDYITGITIGSIMAQMVLNPDRIGQVLFGVGAWGLLSYIFHWVDLKSRKAEIFLDGSPAILVQNGQVLEQNLKHNEMTLNQLEGLLRTKGHFSVSEIEFALLETDGKLSVLPKSQYRPVQPRDLQLPTQYEGMPMQVMHEGQPLKKQLQRLNLSESWLQGELAKLGITDPQAEVFAAWLETSGKLTVDKREDQVQH